MPAPFELVAGLADVYLAVLGTADPPINAVPPVAWVKLGVAGSKDYEIAGVIARNLQTIAEVKTLGTTAPRKAFRTDETVEIELTLMDSTMEAYQAALNQLAITTVVGPPAEKNMPLLQGTTVATRALLVRPIASPYADSANFSQWWIPIVYQKGSPETIYKKDAPVGLKLMFAALQDDVNGLGKLHMPTA